MRKQSPSEFEEACKFDDENRANPLAVRGNSTADELYIYRGDTIPLSDADLESDAERERRYYGTQLPMFACESGFCGV